MVNYPNRYANNLFEQLKPYALKRLRIRKQLKVLDEDAEYVIKRHQSASEKYPLSPQCKEILGSMFDASPVVPDENIVFVDNDEIKMEMKITILVMTMGIVMILIRIMIKMRPKLKKMMLERMRAIFYRVWCLIAVL